MLVELGNHAALRGIDDRPKVTTIFIPEQDDGAYHPTAEWEGGHPYEVGLEKAGALVKPGLQTGGYTHKPGSITVDEFRQHIAEATDLRNGITQLPDHEALLSIRAAWPEHAYDAPAWVKVTPTADPKIGHNQKVCDDVENFLREFYKVPDKAEKPADIEDRYWTRFGAPGVGPADPSLPPLQALFLNQGRVMSNVNDGGGLSGAAQSGTGSAATATSLTTGVAMTLNLYAGYRVYAMQTATGPLIYGNILSNTTGGVLTIDRWYNPVSPGGAAPAAPSAGWQFVIPDGGVVSSWFVGLTTTNITPAATDTALSGEYTVAAGGMFRKIAPYSQTSGVASRSITLTPVYTVNGSDTPLPSTFYAIGAGPSIVVPQPVPLMKWETSLNASATVNAVNDQVTVTWTETGS